MIFCPSGTTLRNLNLVRIVSYLILVPKPLNETELAEIMQIAQDGEKKLREMSDLATIIAEKWSVKT